jgi:hypothetical protein
MTMILTCLTNEFIVQASDRRLTTRREKKIIDKEDDRNKALFYDNHTVFAYTGLATLSNQQFAIDWAAELLAQPTNLQDAMVYLSESATRLMKTRPFSDYSDDQRRLGFVGAGFINWVENAITVRRPAYFIISNFMNHEGKPQPPPYNRFRAYFNYPLPYGEPTFKLFRAGQPLEEDGEKELNRMLRKCFQKRQSKVRPETIGRLLTRAIQETAAINKKVGKNIICTFVPREYREDTVNNRQIHAGGMILNRPVTSEGPQQVTPPRHLSEQERFMMPPLDDLPRSLYIPGDSSSLPLYKAIHVFPGLVVPESCTTDIVLTLPPVKSTGVGEMEITAGDWSTSLTAKLIEGKAI